MTFEQIKELIDLVASHRLSGVELERSGFRLKIDGHRITEVETVQSVPAPASPPAIAAAPAVAAVVAPAAAAEPTPVKSPSPDLYILNSPIVGTFYRAPSPDSPNFVKVGDRVENGQILCIVEAMKLMNEIESDVQGTIVEIYVENAQPVEYGEPLFGIKKS